ALVLRVEGLENANAAQQLEIVKLKAKVKKLERLNKVKSSKFRRLKKVGTSQRVESSDDVENVFNQGRISVDMETDKGIELKVFANMRRVGKGFSGIETPLFESMLAVGDVAEDAEAQVPAQEEVATNAVPPTPTSPSPSSPVIPSSPPYQSPCPPQPQDQVLDTCSAFVLRVEGLENDKAAQQLKKVGTSQRVESSDDVENIFNHGRNIVDMDQDEGIELVTDQEKDTEVEGRHADKQAEIYNIDLDHSSNVKVKTARVILMLPG
nr:hypothetical protein [Tanacetum cinerariifolium]